MLPQIWHWIEIHTGTINESGPYYGFWSGFGSDIQEFAIIGLFFGLLKHHNCGQKGCLRVGRLHDFKMGEITHKLCRHHHPFHKGSAVTGEEIAAHVARAQEPKPLG